MTDETLPMAADALGELYALMKSGESEPARVSAAKILLQQLAPKKTDEEKKHEVEEREQAVAEARGLLAEFAALRVEYLLLKAKMAQASKA
ncbi:MAG: hypothetical protein PHW76_06915 [Alphaproteobacteria bacterium]|nr:hypothetical protein [Alphaproteobacteria bacterium]